MILKKAFDTVKWSFLNPTNHIGPIFILWIKVLYADICRYCIVSTAIYMFPEKKYRCGGSRDCVLIPVTRVGRKKVGKVMKAAKRAGAGIGK